MPLGNESAPIGPTIGTAPAPCAGQFQCQNINIFSTKIYGSNFVKHHSDTAMV